jgi:NADH:ubiquinone oxidoreductase subunit 5 (subunit L)/multisubunit Na+/H+ antiporter MnhA subunit
MDFLLPILLLIPLISVIIGFCFSNKDEKPIFWTSIISVGLNFCILWFLSFLWFTNGFNDFVYQGPMLYEAAETEFAIHLFLDGYAFVYALTATFLTGIIVVFSRTYLHREKGFKRFFNNLKFFYFGLMLVLLSGNLEMLFVGWEVLGVTSFFLIGFYRERYLPVKNALKVVSLYRIADISLLLGIWICHHYFGRSIDFATLDGLHNPQAHILNETFYQFAIPGVFLLAAMVKSAQFPFSSWLPRAIEGPTTSSAIFYGSLSVHIGVFLLIRTAPFWEENILFHVLIATIGLITVVMATITARVQSSIKTQIAYSSIAQIGLMFIEVSLGLYWVAVIHFAGNALLRSHQLMISPSVLSYRIHDQFFHFTPPAEQKTQTTWDKLKLSFYMLGIKEFNLDNFMYKFLWMPLKKAGNAFRFLNDVNTYILALPFFLMGLYAVYHQEFLPDEILRYLPETFALFGLIFILKAFVERKSALTAWVLIIVNQLYQSLAFGFNEGFDFNQVHIYLSGIFIAGLLGVWVINKLRKGNENVTLNQFNGHVYEHPRLAFIFVIACLGLAGFPITPTFIGEDLMLGHIHENQFPLLILIVLNLILDGLVIFRIYARLFLGQHKKGYHEFSYRSS